MRSLVIISMLSICITFFGACNIVPVDIEYDEDQCHACKMIISDSRFGAELITKKGKVYKFDAIECMVPELLQYGSENYKHILVTDFVKPKYLIDATTASFIISDNLPSPMGAFLSAYKSNESGKKALEEHGGKLYSWSEIKRLEDFAVE